MLKKYALIVDTDVFHVMRFDDDHPTAAKWISALDSGLDFVNISDYFGVKPNYTFDGTNFYLPEDINKETPIEKEINQDPNISKYAGLVGNDVIGIFTVEKEESNADFYDMILAGMASNPIIVDCTNDENSKEIMSGWTYSNSKFSKIV